jgi:hypothetical protein
MIGQLKMNKRFADMTLYGTSLNFSVLGKTIIKMIQQKFLRKDINPDVIPCEMWLTVSFLTNFFLLFLRRLFKFVLPVYIGGGHLK